jgi:hypothetical protein
LPDAFHHSLNHSFSSRIPNPRVWHACHMIMYSLYSHHGAQEQLEWTSFTWNGELWVNGVFCGGGDCEIMVVTQSHPYYNANIPADSGDSFFNPTCSSHEIAGTHKVAASTSARPRTCKIAVAYSYMLSILALRDHDPDFPSKILAGGRLVWRGCKV